MQKLFFIFLFTIYLQSNRIVKKKKTIAGLRNLLSIIKDGKANPSAIKKITEDYLKSKKTNLKKNRKLILNTLKAVFGENIVEELGYSGLTIAGLGIGKYLIDNHQDRHLSELIIKSRSKKHEKNVSHDQLENEKVDMDRQMVDLKGKLDELEENLESRLSDLTSWVEGKLETLI